jgi:hypothetical protein
MWKVVFALEIFWILHFLTTEHVKYLYIFRATLQRWRTFQGVTALQICFEAVYSQLLMHMVTNFLRNVVFILQYTRDLYTILVLCYLLLKLRLLELRACPIC